MVGLRRARVPAETAQLAYARAVRLGLPPGHGLPADIPEPAAAQDEEEEPLATLDELRAALADHVPATVRGGRLALGRPAAIGLALLAAAGIALTVSFAWRAHAEPAPLTPTSSVSTVAATTSTSTVVGKPSPTQSPPSVVVVDVAGKVHHPGVVRLPSGSRVIDAIAAAGGALKGVDLTSLNLAAQLQDGEQVIVGTGVLATPSSTPPGIVSSSPSTGPIDLNSATLEDLETLPGIGPALAQRILDWRTAHQRFTSVDELREVSGIGDARFADLAPRVRV